jgi:WD40 repeat protein
MEITVAAFADLLAHLDAAGDDPRACRRAVLEACARIAPDQDDPWPARWGGFLRAHAHLVARGGGAALIAWALADEHLVYTADALVEQGRASAPRLRTLARPLAHRTAPVVQTILAEDTRGIQTFAQCLHPDGRRVITGTDRELLLWDLEDAAVVAAIPLPECAAALDVLPGGDRVVVGCRQGAIVVYTLDPLAHAGVVGRVGAHVYDVRARADGRVVLTVGAGTLFIFDPASGRLDATVVLDGADSSIVLDCEGRRAAALGSDGVARVWDTVTGTIVATFPLPSAAGEARLWPLFFHPDGQSLFVAVPRAEKYGETLLAIDIADGLVARAYEGGLTDVRHASLDVGGARLAASDGRTFARWHAATGELLSAQPVTYGVDDALLFADGRHGVATIGARRLVVWDVAHASPGANDGLLDLSAISSLLFHPDGRRLFAGGSPDGGAAEGLVDIHHLHRGQRVGRLCLPPGLDGLCAIHSDGVRALARDPWSGHSLTAVFRLDTGESSLGWSSLCVNGLCHDAVAFSATGKEAFVGERADTAGSRYCIGVWDLATGARRAQLEGHPDVIRGFVVLRDNLTLVSFGDDGTLRLWDLETKACLWIFEGHAGPVQSAGVLAGSGHLVSGGADGTLRLWDLQSGAALASVAAHEGGVSFVGACPDGRHVVSAGEDEAIRVFDTAARLSPVAAWDAGKRITACAVGGDGTIAYADRAGELFLLAFA